MNVGKFYIDSYDFNEHSSTLNAFIKKRYDILANMLENDSVKKKGDNFANLAIAYQILGDEEKAFHYYSLTPNSVVKKINFLSFCHRYFLYNLIDGFSYDQDYPLQLLYMHNYTNYIYRTKGVKETIRFIRENNLYKRLKSNRYGEQLLNEIYNVNSIMPNIKAGLKLIDTLPYEKCYNKQIKIKDKLKIGLYVSDIQRHRNSASIFEVIEALKNDLYVVVLYDNLFENKLFRMVSNVAKCINISHMCLSEVCRIWDEFHLDGMIDFTDNRLRNNLIAFLPHKESVFSISYLLNEVPLLLSSELYYGNIDYTMGKKNNVVLVLGDFCLVTDSCLKELLVYIKSGKKIIFMDYAFDEPLFSTNFKERLLKLDFNKYDCLIMPIVKPFNQYMKFLCSVDEIFFINESSFVKLSEAFKSKKLIFNLSKHKGFKNTFKSFDDTLSYRSSDNRVQLSREKFSKLVMDKLRKTIKSNFCYNIKDDSKYIITYHENQKIYYIDYTCNGDFVVYNN